MSNKEEWRDVKDYEGFYQVSNKGRVKSLTRIVVDRLGRNKTVYGRILSQGINQNGYNYVVLSKDREKKTCRVHRLVAQAFIDNPNNLPQINHKDENKCNNYVENLEWCTAKYNCNYGTHVENIQKRRDKNSFIKNKSKSIAQLTLEGDLVCLYSSIKEAKEVTGYTNIGNALSGRYYQCGGCCWIYEDEYFKYFL